MWIDMSVTRYGKQRIDNTRLTSHFVLISDVWKLQALVIAEIHKYVDNHKT